jgi:hypothetical protein
VSRHAQAFVTLLTLCLHESIVILTVNLTQMGGLDTCYTHCSWRAMVSFGVQDLSSAFDVLYMFLILINTIERQRTLEMSWTQCEAEWMLHSNQESKITFNKWPKDFYCLLKFKLNSQLDSTL